MVTIETIATVSNNGILAVEVPREISPGKHKIVVIIEEQVQKLAGKIDKKFPTHDIGPWPHSLSLHREDLYNDRE